MGLIVEDGSLVERANTYAGLECADEYCVPRGLWPATDVPVADGAAPDAAMTAAKEAALLRAFDYLNTLEWLGSPLDWQQESAWPRQNVPMPGSDGDFVPEDCIPRAVVQAQLEIAALAFNGTDLLAPLERGGKYQSESTSETIDVISESHSRAYSATAPVEAWLPAVYPLIRAFLAVVPGRGNTFGVYEIVRG